MEFWKHCVNCYVGSKVLSKNVSRICKFSRIAKLKSVHPCRARWFLSGTKVIVLSFNTLFWPSSEKCLFANSVSRMKRCNYRWICKTLKQGTTKVELHCCCCKIVLEFCLPFFTYFASRLLGKSFLLRHSPSYANLSKTCRTYSSCI